MRVQIHPGWEKVLTTSFSKLYFQELMSFVDAEYAETVCYPPKSMLFEAFNRCKFQEIKVVIIGQDPYHGPNQAHGLSFSVPDGVKHPPSLVNIFKEIETDCGQPYPQSGSLLPWAKQGVFLLNATLSVRAHQAGSHQKKGWETFTDEVIEIISNDREGIVFMLWGGYAQKKVKLIDKDKHLILSSGHPSPLSANRGYWFGNRHFSQCNDYLQKQGKTPIGW